MSRKTRYGASTTTYAVVIGLVALGVSLAVSQTGERVSGLTTKVAGSVNAVDGAISGNKGPSYQGLSLADQAVDEFDPMGQINARGFLDPEGDALSYHLALTGGLDAGDFTVQQFPDGVVIDGTPGASGTLAVVAIDPIGRKATAGPMQITVDPNQPPGFSPQTGTDLGWVYGNDPLPAVDLGTLIDPEGDSTSVTITDAGSGQAANFTVAGTGPATLSGTPDAPGPVELTVTWEDAHGATVSAGPYALDVRVDDTSCKTILDTGGSDGSRVYTIDPDDDGSGFQAHCDMETDGGGWTLVTSSYANPAGSTAAPFDVAYATAVNSGVGSPGLGGNYHMALSRYRQLANAAHPVDTAWYAKAGTAADPWQRTLLFTGHYLDDGPDFVWYGSVVEQLSIGVNYIGQQLSTNDRDRDLDGGSSCADRYGSFGWYTTCHNAHFWSTTEQRQSDPDRGGRAYENGYSNYGPDAAGAYDTWYHLKIMVRE